MSAGVVALTDEQRLPVIDLAVAALCENCNGISAAPHEKCVRCGSRALTPLAKILNREAGKVEK